MLWNIPSFAATETPEPREFDWSVQEKEETTPGVWIRRSYGAKWIGQKPTRVSRATANIPVLFHVISPGLADLKSPETKTFSSILFGSSYLTLWLRYHLSQIRP